MTLTVLLSLILFTIIDPAVFSTDKPEGSTIHVYSEYLREIVFQNVFFIEEKDGYLIVKFKNGSEHKLIKNNVIDFGEVKNGN